MVAVLVAQQILQHVHGMHAYQHRLVRGDVAFHERDMLCVFHGGAVDDHAEVAAMARVQCVLD